MPKAHKDADVNRFLTLMVALYFLGSLLAGLLANIADIMRPAPAGLAGQAAFGWLQPLTSGTMWLCAVFATASLLQLQRCNERGEIRTWNAARVAGIVLMLALTLPSVRLWAYALWDWTNGRQTVSFVPFAHLLTALCQPLLFAACAGALWRQWHIVRRLRRLPSEPHTSVFPPPPTRSHPWRPRR
ncbi:hypothetical protein [Conchiformibius kuhniae]|uniref:Uncharacterized protein n=1 Tax=Conchiformibius kuhniae TaxID=211502 RepID=A0A8T9MUW2_9NEIS|nr:hypothetical protein [Conchiformibius kuhniae]UOP04286.1 hypothetical protein LVJ77_07825 [Conchiformibius kuhniae]